MKNAKAYSAASATSRTFTTIPRPELTEHDVQIEILFCGICHSDLHAVRNEWGEFMATGSPIVSSTGSMARTTACEGSFITESNLICKERGNEKTQTRKKQSGSLGYWARLHGNELWLWSGRRQAGDDLGHPRQPSNVASHSSTLRKSTARSQTKNSWVKPSLPSVIKW